MRTMPARPAPAAAAALTASAPAPAAPVPEAAPPRPVHRWAGQEILNDPITAQVLYAAWSGDPAVVVPSPPGAGKTRLVALLGAALAERAELRVGVAAQTRDQAVELARRIGAQTGLATLMWSAKHATPDVEGATVATKGARFPAERGGILIATTARWLYAEPADVGCDLMIVDEAWQATYADLGALGAHARQVVCVGDPGQVAPVVTGETGRWHASPTGPHLPAPEALLAAHGDAVGVVRLRHTWRLGPATTALVQGAFYPALPFTSRRPPEHLTDAAGQPVPELAHRVVTVNAGPTDPALIHACADRARELLTHSLTTATGTRPITAADVAVVCAHVTQAAAVRATLSDHPDLLIGTANQLQGLERPAVVTLHPLAGYRDAAGGFGTDTGRACVMLSRHRAHLTVVLDAATAGVLATAPDDAPGVAVQRTVTDDLLALPTA